MLVGRVVGNVVATQKNEKLEGAKLLLVQPLDLDGKRPGRARAGHRRGGRRHRRPGAADPGRHAPRSWCWAGASPRWTRPVVGVVGRSVGALRRDAMDDARIRALTDEVLADLRARRRGEPTGGSALEARVAALEAAVASLHGRPAGRGASTRVTPRGTASLPSSTSRAGGDRCVLEPDKPGRRAAPAGRSALTAPDAVAAARPVPHQFGRLTPHRSSTSTWTRSTRRSSSATARSCAASPSSWARDPQGGRGRGVVSTASYEARRFGVGSAMPISQAFRLCPQGVYLPPDMEKYARVSKQVMEILRALHRPGGADLDRRGVPRRHAAAGGPSATASGSRATSRTRSGARPALTASVGVAASKLRGQGRLRHAQARRPGGGAARARRPPSWPRCPVRRLWGVGPKMEEELAQARASPPSATWPPSPEAKLRAALRHPRPRPAAPRPGRRRAAGAADVSRGQEPGPRAHLRPGHGRPGAAPRDAARALRHRGPAPARLTACGAARSPSSTATRRSARSPAPTPKLAPTDAGNALFETAWRLFEGRARGREGTPGGDLHVALRRVDQPARPVRGGQAQPAFPADSLRDELRRRFGPEAVTRASLLGRRERRNTSDRAPED